MPITLPQILSSQLTNTTHLLARTWVIERVDGLKFYFTDHNADLLIDGQLFTPVDSLIMSARQKNEGTSPQNASGKGVIVSDKITHSDLRAGRYRNAKITEKLYNWNAPWLGAYYTQIYYINETTFSGEVWSAALLGLAMRLKRTIGRLYTRQCQWTLFDENCGVDPTVFTFTGSVSSLDEARRAFKSSVTLPEDNWLDFGLITFTSGLNNGLSGEVRGSLKNNGTIALQLKMPFDIAPGDTFTVRTGCNKTFKQCKQKYNRASEFGGEPYIPGTDALMTQVVN